MSGKRVLSYESHFFLSTQPTRNHGEIDHAEAGRGKETAFIEDLDVCVLLGFSYVSVGHDENVSHFASLNSKLPLQVV